MALFGKSGAKGTENEVNAKPKAKPSESLGTVLSESVPAASLDIIKTNDAFHASSKDTYDETCFVVATLDVADIGGLNKHMKSDPDKGQFIECIANDNIQVHVSEAGIEQGKFIIIPTPTTIQFVSEFGFLADESRFDKFIPTFVKIDANGNMSFEETAARVPFSWFSNIAKHKISVEEAVANLGDAANAPSANDIASEDVVTPIEAPETYETVMADDQPSIASQIQYNEEPNFEEAENPIMEQPVQEAPIQEPANTYEESQFTESSYDNQYDGMVECPNCHSMMDMNYPCPSCGYSFNSEPAQTPVYEDSNNGAYGGYNDNYTADEETAMNVQDVVREVTEEEYTATCERLFHAGDLDLQITSQPFDMRFVQNNPYVPITENRGDGWLNGYVTQMVKNANSELKRLHNHNLFLARDRYLEIMTAECDKIAKAVDIDDVNNRYNALKNQVYAETQDKKSNLEGEVDRRRSELKDEWDRELNQICESAAAAARRAYIDKNSKNHEELLRRVESELLDDIEVGYQKGMAEINNQRKIEAKRLLDISITATLIASSETYGKFLEQEEVVRQEYLDQIQKFIDDNLKNDVARAQILDEQMKQKSEADKVKEEFTRKINDMMTDNEVTVAKLRDEITQSHAHETTIKNECQMQIDAYEKKEKELNSKFDELMDSYVSLDARKTKEFEERVRVLEDDKKSAEDHLAHFEVVHSKYNKASTVLWVAIAAACLAIGTLIGAKFFGNSNPSNGHYSISLEMQDDAQNQNAGQTTTEP